MFNVSTSKLFKKDIGLTLLINQKIKNICQIDVYLVCAVCLPFILNFFTLLYSVGLDDKWCVFMNPMFWSHANNPKLTDTMKNVWLMVSCAGFMCYFLLLYCYAIRVSRAQQLRRIINNVDVINDDFRNSLPIMSIWLPFSLRKFSISETRMF